MSAYAEMLYRCAGSMSLVKVAQNMKLGAVLLLAAIGSLAGETCQAELMRFELQGNGGNCHGCEWVIADGVITSETPEDFERFVEDEFGGSGGPTLYLNSGGGNLVAGLRLGELIRKYGFWTAVGASVRDGVSSFGHEIVPGVCASACAYAFLGGVSRSAEPGEVGVHQFYDGAALTNPTEKAFDAYDLSSQQIMTGVILEYVVRMGAGAEIVTTAAMTSPGEMHFFDHDELTSFRVTWNPREFDPWRIEPYKSGVVAFTKTRDQTGTVTVFCRQPGVLTALVSEKDEEASRRLQEPNAFDPITVVEGMDAFGHYVPGSMMRTYARNGHWNLEVTVPNFSLARVPAEGDTVDLDVTDHAPRVSHGLSRFLPRTSFAETFSVALRNCI
ncbi:hypothetical protein ACTZWW_04920 [Salinarimonas sp. NSM]|uniref:hypothetical protein n=1 Tax=Salinarimonas sp. NSM TaxID=3458003 RepID=UPI0040357CB5